jgi:hypothetical protein
MSTIPAHTSSIATRNSSTSSGVQGVISVDFIFIPMACRSSCAKTYTVLIFPTFICLTTALWYTIIQTFVCLTTALWYTIIHNRQHGLTTVLENTNQCCPSRLIEANTVEGASTISFRPRKSGMEGGGAHLQQTFCLLNHTSKHTIQHNNIKTGAIKYQAGTVLTGGHLVWLYPPASSAESSFAVGPGSSGGACW